MSSTEAPISINIRTASGTQVTVRANTGEELDQLVANSLASIQSALSELETIAKPAESMAITYAKQALGAQVVQQDIPPFKQSPSVPSLGGGRSCPHGKMTGLQGPSKEGGIYKGYFCPTPQGALDKCKTIYIKKHEPEWNTFVADKIK
jgi:hypothetical protein